jgi:uncharacterized protein YcbK (DUF882 family)
VGFELAEDVETMNAEVRDFYGRVNRAGNGLPGTITSWWRTQKRNREVGGAKHSQHLSGLAVDIAIPAAYRLQAIERLRAQGLVVIDEGDHLHAQRFPARVWLRRNGWA